MSIRTIKQVTDIDLTNGNYLTDSQMSYDKV